MEGSALLRALGEPRGGFCNIQHVSYATHLDVSVEELSAFYNAMLAATISYLSLILASGLGRVRASTLLTQRIFRSIQNQRYYS